MAKSAEHRYERRGITFLTKAKQVEKDWYEWSVEIEKARVALSKIEEVEYILHPTFHDRIRLAKSSEKRFRIESEGWGEFDIAVNIRFKNGDEEIAIVPLKLG